MRHLSAARQDWLALQGRLVARGEVVLATSDKLGVTMTEIIKIDR